MKNKSVCCWIALVLVVIGGLNWGVVGFFDYNVLDAIFGHGSALVRIIYALVGLASLYMIYGAFKCSHSCPKE